METSMAAYERHPGLTGFVGRLIWSVALLLGLLPTASPIHAMPRYSNDLTELSLEELMRIEITTLSRRPQRWRDTPAAVFIITGDDIRRSGVTSIPEALRMVPGMQVARIASDRWAVSSRGFNGSFSNKLQVLVDGRSVYNAVYAGVYWDVQEMLLEDVDRIEVIRGPGASLWGANAVNGVINIVSRSAAEAQGALATATIGTEDKFIGGLRYGGPLSESAHYSSYVKYSLRDESHPSDLDTNGDEWQISKAAGRVDWGVTAKNNLSFLADYYDGTSQASVNRPAFTPPYHLLTPSEEDYKGYDALVRWQHTFSKQSELIVQTYYSHSEKEQSLYSENVDTVDLDMQHRFRLGARQEILWGAGFRSNDGLINNTDIMYFDPAHRTDQLFSAFLQDDISLLPTKLSLIVGSKFERNDYTGWETQPNARLLWKPHNHHTLWAAVSRAVRTPTRYERDVRVNQTSPDYPGVLYSIFGNPDQVSEELIAYEAGYRFYPGKRFGFDLAMFTNQYDDLRTWKMGDPYWDASLGRYVLPFDTVNGMTGDTYGCELAADWQALDWWRLQGAYSYLSMAMRDPYSNDEVARIAEGQSPEHQFSLRSAMDFAHGLELDLWLRYVDDLPAVNQNLPAYWTMDARIGWRVNHWSFDLVGQNLFDPRHPEFVSELLGGAVSEIERGVYVKVTWRY